MKKLSLLVVLLLVFGVFVVGCDEDPTKNFKNPKEIKLKGDKGTTVVTYDDDGNYELQTYGNGKILLNSDENFRIDFEYTTDTLKQVNDKVKNFKKDKNWKVVENLKFRGYKAFSLVNKTYATAETYIYLDEDNEVILKAKISPTKTLETEKEIKKTKNIEDVLLNKDKVQQTLKTIKYTKKD